VALAAGISRPRQWRGRTARSAHPGQNVQLGCNSPEQIIGELFVGHHLRWLSSCARAFGPLGLSADKLDPQFDGTLPEQSPRIFHGSTCAIRASFRRVAE
jgi:hypothetical protein